MTTGSSMALSAQTTPIIDLLHSLDPARTLAPRQKKPRRSGVPNVARLTNCQSTSSYMRSITILATGSLQPWTSGSRSPPPIIPTWGMMMPSSASKGLLIPVPGSSDDMPISPWQGGTMSAKSSVLLSVLASYATEKTVNFFLDSLMVSRPVNPSLVQINMLAKDKNLAFPRVVIMKVAELSNPVTPGSLAGTSGAVPST